MGTGLTDGATGGHGSQGIPVQFLDSHSTPTSISSEFPRIDVSGRALGKDERAPAIQTTSTSKRRRVDFGGCGPPQSPKPHRRSPHWARRLGGPRAVELYCPLGKVPGDPTCAPSEMTPK